MSALVLKFSAYSNLKVYFITYVCNLKLDNFNGISFAKSEGVKIYVLFFPGIASSDSYVTY